MTKLARVQDWDRSRGEPDSRAAGVRPLRYCAFLSYSHADKAIAGWLHEALEKFRTPSSLAGRMTDHGAIPKRLTPIFRDRHELAASDDLADGIRDALDSSRFLIVLCSPAAAASRWVNAEIDMFKRHRPDGCVLAAIVAGEPFASNVPGHEAEECLPPALRQKYDRRGRPTTRRAEPLAADLREDRDGKRLGLLKLVSGMLGVGLDELVQRETQRRQRRLAIVAAASLAGMAVTSTLAVVAFDARDDARDQRREAEGLVGFMLGDLRQKLEPLGRLDVLDSVGARALQYYQKQDTSNLSDAALAQRSKALTLMGEIANTRGNLDTALRLYNEAFAGTAEALRRVPDDPQRLFDHSQNVYWVGYIDWQRGQLERAANAFREYRRLAQRMVELEPSNPRWRLEETYADNSLGAVLIKQQHYREASARLAEALAVSEALLASEPGNEDFQDRLVQALAWLADAREYSGDLDGALSLRERELALLERLARARGTDLQLRRDTLTAHRVLGRLFTSRGESQKALTHLQKAAALADELIRTEPDNTEWAQNAAVTDLDLGELQLAIGQSEAAGVSARAGCAIVTRLIERDSSVALWRSTIRGQCLALRARLALARNAPAEAQALAAARASIARAELARQASPETQFAVAEAELLRGQIAERLGDSVAARKAWVTAAAVWPKTSELRPEQLARQVLLLNRLGRPQEAKLVARRLAEIGYRHAALCGNADCASERENQHE
ncbi:toll/interleukin-1 receptor domain-containing protein [Sphingomonas sp.]|uniref:toll/interleukin-1 receptor domain-containing protein n=1 Tax=Sphingomonas sp. TaxID=28214 RepID=UPI00184EE242|nr:toll/interleukin-1 receptor domain-containing protein [Sphingomonas sp.]MBA3512244.1 toll/interleukin-1 receptor domain-containing protein [Sphingomonas sp.]